MHKIKAFCEAGHRERSEAISAWSKGHGPVGVERPRGRGLELPNAHWKVKYAVRGLILGGRAQPPG